MGHVAQAAGIWLLGGAFTAFWYLVLLAGPLNDKEWHRYFSDHWVLYCEGGLFFVALAALLLKGCDIAAQQWWLDSIQIDSAPPGGQRPQDSSMLLEELDQLSDFLKGTYYARRLNDALEYVELRDSAEGLDEHLKYLSDNDANRQSESYALPMLIVWAIPMLGFLGTVLGITMALGNVSPESLVGGAEKSKDAMQGMLAGLSVAFDTTAVALTQAMILMFIKFVVENSESQLLSTVDSRTAAAIVGRFQETGSKNDPNVATLQRMGDVVVRSCDELVRRQVELWQATIDAAHRQWSALLTTSAQQLDQALSGALEKSLAAHTANLLRLEDAAAVRTAAAEERHAQLLADQNRLLQSQQEELSKHSQVLLKTVEVTGEVVRLEKALRDNLQALSGTRNFEETVMHLAATIHLLNARLSHVPGAVPEVQLGGQRPASRAA